MTVVVPGPVPDVGRVELADLAAFCALVAAADGGTVVTASGPARAATYRLRTAYGCPLHDLRFRPTPVGGRVLAAYAAARETLRALGPVNRLTDLRVLRAVADTGSISAAGRRLHLTQPAASRAVRRLEAHLGGPAVLRSPGGARLTPLGRTALDALEAVEDGLRRATYPGPSAARPPLRVAVMPQRDIAGLVDRLLRAVPDRRVEVAVLQPADATARLAVDVELVVGWDLPEHPVARPAGVLAVDLGWHPMWVALPARHPLARSAAPVRLTDLRDEAWAAWSDPTVRTALRTWAGRYGVRPDVVHTADDGEALRGLVAAGAAVALALGTAPDGPAVVVRPLAELMITRPVVLGAAGTGRTLRAVAAALHDHRDTLVRGTPRLLDFHRRRGHWTDRGPAAWPRSA